jgi:hypothetical protein
MKINKYNKKNRKIKDKKFLIIDKKKLSIIQIFKLYNSNI